MPILHLPSLIFNQQKTPISSWWYILGEVGREGGRNDMQIIREKLNQDKLTQMAETLFGDMVKGVVDVEREVLAIDAELHSDLEAALLQDGSKQENLWGINLYPDLPRDEWIGFDSLINVRPSQGNRSRNVEDQAIRNMILSIIEKRIAE